MGASLSASLHELSPAAAQVNERATELFLDAVSAVPLPDFMRARARADALLSALSLLQTEEVSPSDEDMAVYEVLWTEHGSWEELCATFSAEDVRYIRDQHPRNLALLLALAVAALEREVASEQPEREAALGGLCRLLARVLPFVLGEAGGAGGESLAQLQTFLEGGQLPPPRRYTPPRVPAAGSLALADDDVADAAAAHDEPPPSGPPLWLRLASALASALLCLSLTLPPRAAAWALPLSPGAASPPPDDACSGARLEALRPLLHALTAESLCAAFPHAPASPPASRILAAFSGRGEGLPGSRRAAIYRSLLAASASAPGLRESLVAAAQRALLLLVLVADEDCAARAAADDSASAAFAAMPPPAAHCLHASLVASLRRCASAAAGAAGWAAALGEEAAVVGGSSAERIAAALRCPVPAGAAEALALALAALERAPAFAEAAEARGGGGWELASPALALSLALRDQPGAAGLQRCASLLLLQLSATPAFAASLNAAAGGAADSALSEALGLPQPPPGCPPPTRADLLLSAAAQLLAFPLAGGRAPQPQAIPAYHSLLALLVNVSPHLKALTASGAGATVHLLASLSQPAARAVAAASAPTDAAQPLLLDEVLCFICNALTYQGECHGALLGALLRERGLLDELAALGEGENAPQAAPLATIRALLAQLAPAHAAWRGAHPGPEGGPFQEAAFMGTLSLVGLRGGALPPPPPPRAAQRSPELAAWQAQHAAGCCLLAEPAAMDGERVRRLRVSTLRATTPRPAAPQAAAAAAAAEAEAEAVAGLSEAATTPLLDPSFHPVEL